MIIVVMIMMTMWMKMNLVNLKTPSGPLKMIIVVVVDRGGDEYNGDDDDNDEYNHGQLKDPSGLLKSSRHQTQSYSSPQMIELIDCTIGDIKKGGKVINFFLQNNKLFTSRKVYRFLILQTIINMFSIFRGWLVLKAALLRC